MLSDCISDIFWSIREENDNNILRLYFIFLVTVHLYFKNFTTVRTGHAFCVELGNKLAKE